ncbi:Voltage-gated hydrogen channel 1 [Hondaea fermentalgiana]|uniref:Voltage-gated hydrogen channel 1 n=1 Tax=Hondaea fermentalgiana TaxID=2315210 RepID=A0A2R5FZB8_9STRA|nr:Voltage-gated hydrogen channel 1 [Hondaea fermentalgiana]|eukprot:GBG24097.1 Voltage-gated hydrogen channel 1 [Hondaea fermentalgiana]
MLQTQELQFVLVVLIVVDFLSAFYMLFADAKGWETPFLKVLEYQSGMALLAYALEIGLILVAFRGEVFAHLGYSLDMMLVGIMFYGVLSTASWATAARLLNVFRLWRAVRMVNAALLAQEQEVARTRGEVSLLNEKIEALKLKAKRADLAHKREVDKNKRLEQNFRAQRDELDTLREALQIAAQTMAKVQGLEGIADLMGEQDQLELAKAAQEEEEEEEDDDDDEDDDDGDNEGVEDLLENKSARDRHRKRTGASRLVGEQSEFARKSSTTRSRFGAVPEEDSESDNDDEFADSNSGPETNETASVPSQTQSPRGKVDADNAERDVEEHKETSAGRGKSRRPTGQTQTRRLPV